MPSTPHPLRLLCFAPSPASSAKSGADTTLAQNQYDSDLEQFRNAQSADRYDALTRTIDGQITALDAGSYKPAAGHWERFFERYGADRDQHVHVAASLFHDIEPAGRLGLRAVWINRLGEKSDLPRAAELRDLSRLPAVLDELVPATV